MTRYGMCLKISEPLFTITDSAVRCPLLLTQQSLSQACYDLCYFGIITESRNDTAFVPERSKGLDSSSSVFVLVGSNPTECIFYMFSFWPPFAIMGVLFCLPFEI